MHIPVELTIIKECVLYLSAEKPQPDFLIVWVLWDETFKNCYSCASQVHRVDMASGKTPCFTPKLHHYRMLLWLCRRISKWAATRLEYFVGLLQTLLQGILSWQNRHHGHAQAKTVWFYSTNKTWISHCSLCLAEGCVASLCIPPLYK